MVKATDTVDDLEVGSKEGGGLRKSARRTEGFTSGKLRLEGESWLNAE